MGTGDLVGPTQDYPAWKSTLLGLILVPFLAVYFEGPIERLKSSGVVNISVIFTNGKVLASHKCGQMVEYGI